MVSQDALTVKVLGKYFELVLISFVILEMLLST